MMDIVDRLRGWDDASRKNSSSWETEAADEIDRLRAEVASLSEQYASDGRRIVDLTQQLVAANGRVEMLAKAGQAVVDRWDMPKWKDAAHTAEYINALRAALSNLNENSAE